MLTAFDGCRDFASGFLVAEICSRYHPVEFEMHSFEHVISNERKAANWALLEKRFRVLQPAGLIHTQPS